MYSNILIMSYNKYINILTRTIYKLYRLGQQYKDNIYIMTTLVYTNLSHYTLT